MILRSPQVLVTLDVDGVLNRVGPPLAGEDAEFGSAYVADGRGREFLIRTAPAIIQELDDLVNLPGVQLGWLTTWGSSIDRLIEGTFGGKLTGGVVIGKRPPQRFAPIDWKLRALIEYLEGCGSPPLIWADDDAVLEAQLYRPEFTDAEDRLLIAPRPEIGLTLDDVEAIREFIDGVLSA